MLSTPVKKPLRATRNGTYRINIAVRQDLYIPAVRNMLQQFGEIFGFEKFSPNLMLDPLFDPLEVIDYINSYTDEDCSEFNERYVS